MCVSWNGLRRGEFNDGSGCVVPVSGLKPKSLPALFSLPFQPSADVSRGEFGVRQSFYYNSVRSSPSFLRDLSEAIDVFVPIIV